MRTDPLAFLTTDLESLKQQGLYRHLRVLEGEQKPTTSFDHRQVVNLSSNNYLGLTTHPRLREAALDATRKLGVGSGSVRTIAGTMDQSDQGPVYLGYRLGHIRNESRIFRALVYNKSAAVLHMLRGLVGDEAFFAGMRRFYRTNRFKKAGTEDFRAAMEASSGQSLERFFERWIYGSSIPRVKLAYTVNGNEAVLHVEQLGEEIFDFPLIVSFQYADRKPVDVTIRVTDRSTETRVPLTGALRGVEPSKDASTLAEITKS